MSLLLAPLDGWSRARLLKRFGWFHAQGSSCYFAVSTFGSEPWLLAFGNNVYVAAGVRFVTHDVSVHMVKAAIQHDGLLEAMGRISVGSNVFIGLNAILLPGVTICDDVVIGAGAVVSSSIAQSGVYVGVPARRILSFEEYAAKLIQQARSYPWCTGPKALPPRALRAARAQFFWGNRNRSSIAPPHDSD